MLRRAKREHGEHGQIIVLFALALVVILAFAAVVVDIGMLRNDRQNLANTMDAAALAGGTVLPVSSGTPLPTGTTSYATAVSLIQATVTTNYPGLTLPTIANGGITFRCLIGATSTGAPDLTQVTAGVCNPSHATGHNPPLAGDFTGAGLTRESSCRPDLGDVCNVVLVSGVATQAYGFARVLGINSGSTGTVQSAACNGPCGASPVVPVDLVVILDRTASMAGTDSGGQNKIQALQNAAKAVLGVYDPSKQRVALGLTGPSAVNSSGSPTASCGSGSAYGTADDNNFAPQWSLTQAISTATATTIHVGSAYSIAFPTAGNFSITIDDEQMLVTAGQGTATWTVTRGYNGSTKATHSNGASVAATDGWASPASSIPLNQLGMWVPVGLSGTDTTSPLPNPTGAAGTYSINGAVQAGSTIVKAISCISAQSQGTNLATPIQMAQKYLDTYGRKNVTQGIILETDGHPQYGFNPTNQWNTNFSFTCQAAINAATVAKADTTNSPQGIQIFTVGYGVDNTVRCPYTTNNMSNNNGTYNYLETSAWSGALATTFLSAIATDPSHFYDDPPSSQLAAVFTQAAEVLSHSGLHLIQPYPAPIVMTVSPTSGPAAGNTAITVGGEYFTGATSVQVGGISVGFTVVNDTTITVSKVPAGTSGNTVDVVVTTGGGSSPPNSGDQYKYN